MLFYENDNTEIFPFLNLGISIPKKIIFKIQTASNIWLFEFNSYTHIATKKELTFSNFVKLIKDVDSSNPTTYQDFANFHATVAGEPVTGYTYNLSYATMSYFSAGAEQDKYFSLTNVINYEVI